MKKIIISFLFSLTAIIVSGQTITGTVYDKNSNPLPGVNIYWEQTQKGTMTDANGVFAIERHKSVTSLVFSFIGYANDTVAITPNISVLKINLSDSKELKEVVVSERRESVKMDKMSAMNTQTLTGCELKKAACCNLSESFETNASVDVSYSDAVTGAKQIQLLGLSGKYVQTLTENYPNFIGLANTYGMTYIPGPWMSAISISKGTASVINGYDAITGQINVEYLKPAKSDKFYINLFANSGYKFESNIHSSIKFNDKWSTMLLFHNGNNYTKIDHNHDGFLDMPLTQQYHIFNRWDYFNGKGFSWRSGVKYLYEDKLAGQIAFDPEQTRDTTNGFGIGIDTRRVEAFSKMGFVMPNNPTQSIALITNYSFHDQKSFYGLNDYDATQNSIYANLIFQTDIYNANHTFSSGIDLRNNAFDETLNGVEYDKTETDIGAYAQYTYKPNLKLTALTGLRADYNSLYELFITPRGHVKYQFNEHLTGRVSAGKGFRSPNIIAENSYLLASSREIKIDPDLRMEEAWNYGASLAQNFFINNRKWRLGLDYYHTNFINQIVVDVDSDVSAIKYYNLKGKSYANNYQVELNANPIRGLEATVAFRISDVKTQYGEDLLSKPLTNRYKGLFTASYQTPLKKWQFDFTAQLNGDGRIPSTEANPEKYQLKDEFPPYTVLNAQVTKYYRKWNVYVGSENLLNYVQENPIIAADDPFGSHFDASMIWGPVHGRKVYVGLRYMIER